MFCIRFLCKYSETRFLGKCELKLSEDGGNTVMANLDSTSVPSNNTAVRVKGGVARRIYFYSRLQQEKAWTPILH